MADIIASKYQVQKVHDNRKTYSSAVFLPKIFVNELLLLLHYGNIQIRTSTPLKFGLRGSYVQWQEIYIKPKMSKMCFSCSPFNIVVVYFLTLESLENKKIAIYWCLN